MKIKYIALCLAWAVLAVSSTHASATTIASWDLANENGNQAFTAGVGSANVTALNVARGPGLTHVSAAGSISAFGWHTLNPAQDYFTFGFTVDPGLQVDLDKLFIGTRASNTGPRDVGLFYSGDGFANSLHTFTHSGISFLNSEIDLSSLTALDGTVEFRLVALSDARASGDPGVITTTGTLRITNFFDAVGDTGSFRFTGTLVPEPSSLSLVGLALGCFGGLARRRR